MFALLNKKIKTQNMKEVSNKNYCTIILMCKEDTAKYAFAFEILSVLPSLCFFALVIDSQVQGRDRDVYFYKSHKTEIFVTSLIFFFYFLFF